MVSIKKQKQKQNPPHEEHMRCMMLLKKSMFQAKCWVNLKKYFIAEHKRKKQRSRGAKNELWKSAA